MRNDTTASPESAAGSKVGFAETDSPTCCQTSGATCRPLPGANTPGHPDFRSSLKILRPSFFEASFIRFALFARIPSVQDNSASVHDNSRLFPYVHDNSRYSSPPSRFLRPHFLTRYLSGSNPTGRAVPPGKLCVRPNPVFKKPCNSTYSTKFHRRCDLGFIIHHPSVTTTPDTTNREAISTSGPTKLRRPRGGQSLVFSIYRFLKRVLASMSSSYSGLPPFLRHDGSAHLSPPSQLRDPDFESGVTRETFLSLAFSTVPPNKKIFRPVACHLCNPPFSYATR